MKQPAKQVHFAPKPVKPKQFNKAAQMAQAEQLRKPKAARPMEPDADDVA